MFKILLLVAGLLHHREITIKLAPLPVVKGEVVAFSCEDDVVGYFAVAKVGRSATWLRLARQEERGAWAADPVKPIVDICPKRSSESRSEGLQLE